MASVVQISYVLVQFDYFVCPIEYDDAKEALSMECERNPEFRLHEYALPQFLQNFGILVREEYALLTLPFQKLKFH